MSSGTAMRTVASAYGILVGLAGIEHGVFEMLQGDVATGGVFIDAIGDAQRFWPGAAEAAVTVVPSYLLTGILAVIFGILVVVWSGVFVQRRLGASILLVLTVALFLVGGGFAPIFLSILAVAAATRIDRPLPWWRAHLPASVRGSLAKLWPGILITFVIVFWSAVGIQIFGLPLDVTATTSLMQILSAVMVALMPIVVVVGLASDTQTPPSSQQGS